MNETLNLLVSSFGGATALKRKAPICAGRYNSTKANDVSDKVSNRPVVGSVGLQKVL